MRSMPLRLACRGTIPAPMMRAIRSPSTRSRAVLTSGARGGLVLRRSFIPRRRIRRRSRQPITHARLQPTRRMGYPVMPDSYGRLPDAAPGRRPERRRRRRGETGAAATPRARLRRPRGHDVRPGQARVAFRYASSLRRIDAGRLRPVQVKLAFQRAACRSEGNLALAAAVQPTGRRPASESSVRRVQPRDDRQDGVTEAETRSVTCVAPSTSYKDRVISFSRRKGCAPTVRKCGRASFLR